jgi:hypothetical protein
MTLVLELSAGDLARSRRQVWRQSLQCLNVGQFVRAHGRLSCFAPLPSSAIHRAHLSDLRLAVGVAGRGEPVPHSMGLQVGCF